MSPCSLGSEYRDAGSQPVDSTTGDYVYSESTARGSDLAAVSQSWYTPLHLDAPETPAPRRTGQDRSLLTIPIWSPTPPTNSSPMSYQSSASPPSAEPYTPLSARTSANSQQWPSPLLNSSQDLPLEPPSTSGSTSIYSPLPPVISGDLGSYSEDFGFEDLFIADADDVGFRGQASDLGPRKSHGRDWNLGDSSGRVYCLCQNGYNSVSTLNRHVLDTLPCAQCSQPGRKSRAAGNTFARYCVRCVKDGVVSSLSTASSWAS